ncbi:MAG: BspA family leucine-rich repeat surface protein [Cyclobacteriaceae bacterium]|nr:BspA family leucine-rich repeat surface protein [Cyclobacteriaceae bacterium]
MKKFTHTTITMVCLFLGIGLAHAQNEFITTWQTTTTSESITIPTNGPGYDYTVDWGDGTIENNFTGDASHIYTSGGTYTVKISGDFPQIFFNNVGDKDKILTIEQWGNIAWTSMFRSFFGCSNLNVNATDAPDLSGVNNLSYMFQGASSLTADLNNWDVSTITQMNQTFAGAINFNGDITSWDVSNVVDMVGMFFQTPFNQPIGNWNVGNVTTMLSMFKEASFNKDISNWDVSSVTKFDQMFGQNVDFNQPIDGWDVSSATTMSQMFRGASSFNQPLNSWNVANVNNMYEMFYLASSFNQPINNWNVGQVTTMKGMFYIATSFDQDLSGWDITSVTNMQDIFTSSNLSNSNYDKLLQVWAVQSVQSGVTFGAMGIEYCLGATARNTLVTTYGWVITDGGEYCVVNIPDANFKAALLANTSINTTDDGEITFQEASAYSGSLDISNLSIADLTGIEAFIELTSLTANDNSLTSLDLTSNTKLTSIQAYNNNLTSVDLTGLNLLYSINFTNSDLTTIDLTDQTALTTLYLIGNPLTSIDLSNNTSINLLGIQNCGLDALDLTGLTSLQSLYAQDNNLTGLDLSDNSSLKTLFLGNNSLSSLDLSNNTLITDLRLMNNALVSLDLTSNTALEKIFANDNLLETLNVANGNNGVVTTFDASGNFNLTCITVDDVAYAQTNWTDIDAGANFSTDCSNVENDITAFSFAEQSSAASIDALTHSIDVEVTFGTDLSSLVPTFVVSSGATADPASGVAQDFRSAFTYTITAENPTAIQEWTVNLTEENVAPTDISIDNSSLDENNTINAVVGELSTTDGNGSDTHTYALVAGTGDTDNASFDISGSSLLALESFDFETKSSYSVRIQTNDGNGGVFEKALSISVNDVSGVAQTITFDPIEDVTVESTGFELSASSSSGLAVTFMSSDESVATVSGTTVTIVGAGSTTIIASQAGDGDYAAAASMERILTVHKLSQIITFEPIDDQLLEEGTLTLTASASSGLDVTYSVIDGPATASGNIITFTGQGEVMVKASQSGNDTYAAAEPVEQTFDILTVTGINDNLGEEIVRIYPNPVANMLFVEKNEGFQEIQVINMSGSLVLRSESNSTELDVSQLKQGNYIVRVITPTGIITNQIIKK